MIELDGMQLHYETPGEGEPLLWLHGFLGAGADWQHIFGSPPAGYRIIAPDLRGHGQSTGASPTYSFRQSATDVFALLDHLHIGEVKIIGVSGGGITALHMATREPARVTRMVVVSAPPVFPAQARAIQRTFSEAEMDAAGRERLHRTHPRQGQAEQLVAQARALAEGDDPDFSAPQLATIRADTLIVAGDSDSFYPVSLAVQLREAIPQSLLWVVPGGGHSPVFGPAAPGFAELALQFLAGHLRPAQA